MLESLSIPRYSFPDAFNSIPEPDPLILFEYLSLLIKEVMDMGKGHQSESNRISKLSRELTLILLVVISFALIGSG